MEIPVDERKLLTVIVPSYNMEAYLPKCLGSLVIEDVALRDRLDVIVVNDGSKDRTSEIAHSFEAEYPGVFRVIDKPNGHYGSCINAALPIAAGKYVRILDADDSYDTAMLGRFLAELDGLSEETDLVLTDFVHTFLDSKPEERIVYPLKQGVFLSAADLVTCRADMMMHTICYRTALLREIGYRQSEGMPYTDTEWCYLPTSTCTRIRYFPLPVYRYLMGRDGQTMEREACVNGRFNLERMMDRMFAQYDERTDEDRFCRAYLEMQLCRTVNWLISIYTLSVKLSDCWLFFRKLRELSERYGFIRAHVAGIRVFASSPLSWKYLESALSNALACRLVLLFVRGYVRLGPRLRG